MGRPPKRLDPSTSPAARLGVSLRERREDAGITQTELASAINFSRTHLAQVELAQVIPSEDFVRLCDEALGAAGSLLALYPAVIAERDRRGGATRSRRRASARRLTDSRLAPAQPPVGEAAPASTLLPAPEVGAGSWSLRRSLRRTAGALFGSSPVTIALPLRLMGAGRELLAHEDFEAGERLATFLRGLGIDVSLTKVSPSGEIDLSAEGLIAICGPKSSPVIAEQFDNDPHFGFLPDRFERWRIIERATGNEILSPLDRAAPTDQDLAYVGRLPRPDRSGTFLLIAGIHAIGSLGAVHFLTQAHNLKEVHRAVGEARFSMVVSCAFQRLPLTITSSEAFTVPRVHHSRHDEER
ncbi:MAG: helix-turn-helix transcriptional regulator [Actinomycetota bacterium]|nr:helix-turn-helix transcriptional regulator [Actinomycetota bacterium]